MNKHDDVFKHLQDVRSKSINEITQTEPVVPQYWELYQQGDTAVTSDLLKSLSPTIDSAINSYAGGNQEYRTKAKIIALEAVKTYDPTKGTKLETHVYNNLKRLQRLVADRGNVIHVPEQSALDKLQLEKTINNYTIDNGTEPSLQQLSDLTGMSIKKIKRLQNISGQTSSSMVTGEQGNSLDAAPRTAITLYEDTLYQELDPTDQKIYEWLTGYNDTPMLNRQEVATRLGITPAALSQRITKIDRFFAENGYRIEEVLYGRQVI
jgi:DNA-directed RNA polymerase specialized sigma subunit